MKNCVSWLIVFLAVSLLLWLTVPASAAPSGPPDNDCLVPALGTYDKVQRQTSAFDTPACTLPALGTLRLIRETSVTDYLTSAGKLECLVRETNYCKQPDGQCTPPVVTVPTCDAVSEHCTHHEARARAHRPLARVREVSVKIIARVCQAVRRIGCSVREVRSRAIDRRAHRRGLRQARRR